MNQGGHSRQSFGRKARTLLSLLSLMKMSSGSGEIVTSTGALAEILGVSQQTGSILLRELASAGLIMRRMSRRGERITLTPKAYDVVTQELAGIPLDSLSKASRTSPLKITGRAFTGKGEGAYYISQRAYSKQIEDKLGFAPYLGTLNLRVTKLDDINKLTLIYGTTPIVLKGFSTRERAFGDVQCYRVKVEGVSKVALVRSNRTAYDLTVVELISDKYLRKALSIKDGDGVSFSFPA